MIGSNQGGPPITTNAGQSQESETPSEAPPPGSSTQQPPNSKALQSYQDEMNNYLIALNVPIGARGQVDMTRGNHIYDKFSPGIMACPNKADLKALHDEFMKAIPQGQQAEQNVEQFAANAGCVMIHNFEKGVAVAKDDVDPTKNFGTDGYVQVQMDSGIGVFWMPNSAFVPLHEPPPPQS
ncbi:hypothetical protein [Acidocella sp.]|uniref:hypothetical protein n=1 Tax=Acidocella sp. TaxID=50710 RepID=UPI001850E442|nr:hypothetical protein [Acidocella sp.]NNM56848.1 hypothetical protein [Acidocella sp.]